MADATTEVAREDAAEGRRMAPIHFLDFELVGQSRSGVRILFPFIHVFAFACHRCTRARNGLTLRVQQGEGLPLITS